MVRILLVDQPVPTAIDVVHLERECETSMHDGPEEPARALAEGYVLCMRQIAIWPRDQIRKA